MKQMTENEKLYFPEWDDEYCDSLSILKDIARKSGIDEFDATEAVPDNTQHEIYWCDTEKDFSERKYCCKFYCKKYQPNKSGRDTCRYRKHCCLPSKKKIHVKII